MDGQTRSNHARHDDFAGHSVTSLHSAKLSMTLMVNLSDKKAEYGLVVIAEEPYAEGMGDRFDLQSFTKNKLTLIENGRSACEKLSCGFVVRTAVNYYRSPSPLGCFCCWLVARD